MGGRRGRVRLHLVAQRRRGGEVEDVGECDVCRVVNPPAFSHVGQLRLEPGELVVFIQLILE